MNKVNKIKMKFVLNVLIGCTLAYQVIQNIDYYQNVEDNHCLVPPKAENFINQLPLWALN
jgi:hypothetical protein